MKVTPYEYIVILALILILLTMTYEVDRKSRMNNIYLTALVIWLLHGLYMFFELTK